MEYNFHEDQNKIEPTNYKMNNNSSDIYKITEQLLKNK